MGREKNVCSALKFIHDKKTLGKLELERNFFNVLKRY